MKLVKAVTVLCASALLAGCATKRPALPSEHTTIGTIDGLKNARFWGDENLVDPAAYSAEMREQILAADPEELNRPQNFLAISGRASALIVGMRNGEWQVQEERPFLCLLDELECLRGD